MPGQEIELTDIMPLAGAAITGAVTKANEPLVQEMERVRQALERIAEALEGRDRGESNG